MEGEPPLFSIAVEPDSRPERILLLPDPTIAQQRIHDVIDGATKIDLDRGADWYFAVNKLCIEMAEESPLNHITPIHVAGIIAALSPMRSWPDNVSKAREAVQTGSARGLGHTVETSTLIWNGFDPELVLARTKNNPKVQSFFHNIAYPESSDAVTIDRHMWNLLFDDLNIVKKAGLRFKGGEYQWAADQFRKVAAEIGLLPHQLQAISWLAWRRQHGIVDYEGEQLSLGLT